jgi:hypothetical protein
MAKGNQELVGGRFTHYGARGQDAKRGEAVSRVGSVTELEYVFDWNDVPTFSATNEMIATIPSGSIIERVVLVSIGAGTSAASTDAFVVNAVRPAGTGGTVLLSTTRASIDAVNKAVIGAGAGLNVSLAGATHIQVVPTAFTGGKFKLNVEYRAPAGDSAGVKTY